MFDSNSCVLVIEASMPQASVALYDKGTLVASSSWKAERSHNARIFDALDALGISRGNTSSEKDTSAASSPASSRMSSYVPDWILVGSGPGSYSGIRVALAVADGLALIYGARVVALPSWEAMAPLCPGDYAVLTDARRQSWALGRISEATLVEPLIIESATDMTAHLDALRREGIPLLSSESEEKLSAQGWDFVHGDVAPSADALFRAWLAKSPTQRETLAFTPPSPFYVRDPHITPAKPKGRPSHL